VTDVTTVKNLVLYEDPAYTTEQSTYPAGNAVYGKSYGLTDGESYYYRWLDPTGAILRASPVINNLVAFPDTYEIPAAGPFGAWTVQVCNNATTASCTIFAQTKFYVGPDHLQADYSGADPTTGANLLIDLALHDRFNHVVPVDASGNLVGGDPADPEGPLMITVTVSGSAEIVDDPLLTTLGNYSISGQTITGRLDETTGTARIVIRSAFPGVVTVTPASYKGVLYGSPVRDHSVTLDFAVGGPDHYEIVHDGSALTCVPEEIMIVACSDAACTAQLAAPATLTLTPSGWVGGDSVTFTGSTSARLRHVAPGTVTLAMAGQAPPAGNGYRCVESIGGPAAACEMVYYDSGFDFAIPAQTSCKSSGDIVVSAIGRDPETNQCVPLFADSTHNLSFWSTYLNPNTGAEAVRVNGAPVAGASPGTSLALGFDTNGQAPIQVSYGDAGQVRLDARYLGTGAEVGLEMLGNDAFVVAPAGLCVYADGAGSACVSGDANCTAFIAAGAPFDLKVKGVCWEIDGEADSDFCDNPTTSNFQLTNIVVSHSLVAPGAGDPGAITVAGFDLAAADSGEHTISNQTVSEVGVFTFTADPPAYLGAGDLIPTSTSANIGRFYPDHFQVTIAPDPPTLLDSCLAGSFTYLGEPFGFTVAPVLTVTAVNRGGVITGNYDCAGFWKLPEPFTLNYTYSDGAGAGPVLAPAASSADPAAGATTDCNGSVSMTISDNFTYSRPPLTAPVPPFGADLSLNAIAAAFTDSDTVCFDPGSGCQGFGRNGMVGASLRFGRSVAANGYAPETVTGSDPLLMRTAVQYYDDPDGWVINADDGCSQYDYAITANGTITVAVSPVSPVTLIGGAGILELWPTGDPAPAGGSVELDYDFPSWLEPDLLVEAFFGIHRGNDRIINWREIVR
jgi:MSHA biogenesis protein MshQ